MSPDLLRRIDRWIGVPLCALLSVLPRRPRPAAPAGLGKPGQPARILFIQLAESGSMVLAAPAVRWITESAVVDAHFLTLERNRPALRLTGAVEDSRILALRTKSAVMFAADLAMLIRRLRQSRFDAIVDFELFSRLTAAFAAISGIPRRVGFHDPQGRGATWRGELFTHPVEYRGDRHVSENYLALCHALLPTATTAAPVAPAIRRPDITALRQARDLIAGRFPERRPDAPLLLLNPNASQLLPQRRWPPGHFVSLISRLIERHPAMDIMVIGSTEDRGTTAAITRSVGHPRCADAAGQIDLSGLHALFGEATLLVSNDSGPAHFATLAGLPAIVLFGPESPDRYRPLGPAVTLTAGLACSPCVGVENQRRSDCADNRCMQAIRVEAVLAEVEAFLARASAQGSEGPPPDSAAAGACPAVVPLAAYRKAAGARRERVR